MDDLRVRDVFAAFILSVASLWAQSNKDDCPHQSVERVPASIIAGNVVSCGSGVQLNFGTVSYTSPPASCALLLTCTPEHYTTKSTPGSNTYTEPSGQVWTYVARYQCRSSYFLWFIPIGSTCEEVSFMQASRIDNYAQRRCGG